MFFPGDLIVIDARAEIKVSTSIRPFKSWILGDKRGWFSREGGPCLVVACHDDTVAYTAYVITPASITWMEVWRKDKVFTILDRLEVL